MCLHWFNYIAVSLPDLTVRGCLKANSHLLEQLSISDLLLKWTMLKSLKEVLEACNHLTHCSFC